LAENRPFNCAAGFASYEIPENLKQVSSWDSRFIDRDDLPIFGVSGIRAGRRLSVCLAFGSWRARFWQSCHLRRQWQSWVRRV